MEVFTNSSGRGSHLGDFSMDTLDSETVINDEENSCGFED